MVDPCPAFLLMIQRARESLSCNGEKSGRRKRERLGLLPDSTHCASICHLSAHSRKLERWIQISICFPSSHFPCTTKVPRRSDTCLVGPFIIALSLLLWVNRTRREKQSIRAPEKDMPATWPTPFITSLSLLLSPLRESTRRKVGGNRTKRVIPHSSTWTADSLLYH